MSIVATRVSTAMPYTRPRSTTLIPSSGSTTSRIASSRSSSRRVAGRRRRLGIPAAPRTTSRPRPAVFHVRLSCSGHAHGALRARSCDAAGHGVLERHPAQQRALHPRRVAGHPGERHAVAEHVLVRPTCPRPCAISWNAASTFIESVTDRPTTRSVSTDADAWLIEHPSVSYETSDTVSPSSATRSVISSPQVGLIWNDSASNGSRRPAPCGRPVVVQDDLLVHLLQLHSRHPEELAGRAHPVHQRGHLVRRVVHGEGGARRWRPPRSAGAAATRSGARPARRRPRSSSTCPTSWACTPSTTNATAPPRDSSVVGPDDPHARAPARARRAPRR